MGAHHMGYDKNHRLNRRDLLRLGGAIVAGSAAAFRPATAFGETRSVCPGPDPSFILQGPCAGTDALEVYPTSPLILDPFTDPLPIPMPLAPVPKSDVDTWA